MDTPNSPKVVCVPQALDKDDDSSLGDDQEDEDKPVWEIKSKSRFSPTKVMILLSICIMF